MPPTSCRKRLLFNPLFRALWIGMVASSVGTWLYFLIHGHALSSMPTALLIATVRMATGPQIWLLALLSAVVSIHAQRHGHREFGFQRMGSGAFAVSILTFLGFAGPWVMLCTAFVLGLCAAMAMLSIQALLLDILSKTDVPRGLALGAIGMHLGRTACNLASGVLATVAGPAAIFVLSAISLCVALIAGRAARSRRLVQAQPS